MVNATRRRLVKALLFSAAGLALSGCGQKGPLYLPDETEDEKKKAEDLLAETGDSPARLTAGRVEARIDPTNP